jgi:hypothetical protein
MNVDWVVAMGVFIAFVSWSFVYYFGIFADVPSVAGDLDSINEKITDFLTESVWTLPVVYDSSTAETGILYLDNSWPNGTKESIIVMSGGESLNCMLSDDRLYWEADLVAGENIFSVLYADLEVPARCDSTLEPSGANQTISMVAETREMVSESRIVDMITMSPVHFALLMGINRDFRVEWEMGGESYKYGQDVPRDINVYVKETVKDVMEGSGPVSMRVVSW